MYPTASNLNVTAVNDIHISSVNARKHTDFTAVRWEVVDCIFDRVKISLTAFAITDGKGTATLLISQRSKRLATIFNFLLIKTNIFCRSPVEFGNSYPMVNNPFRRLLID